MSVNTRKKADELVAEVTDYFEELEADALPKVLEDLQHLDEYKSGAQELTHRLVNLIFKDSELLKAAMFCRKKIRKGAEGDEEAAPASAPAPPPGASAAAAPPPRFIATPKTYKWTAKDRADLLARADAHEAYLRRLKTKRFATLDYAEKQRIADYVARTGEWMDRVRSKVDLTTFLFNVMPLLDEIERLEPDVMENAQSTTHFKRMARIDRTPVAYIAGPSAVQLIEGAPGGAGGASDGGAQEAVPECFSSSFIPPVETPTAARTPLQQLQVEAPSTEANKRVLELFADVQRQCKYVLGLYGHTRGSGNVVENPVVPCKRRWMPDDEVDLVVPQLQSEQTVDPWVASGLVCASCGVMRVRDDHQAQATCPQCAVVVPMQATDHTAFNFGDEPELKKGQRKNYDHDGYALKWLQKVQGKIGIEIPESTWTLLFNEFRQRRLATVDEKIVRQTLKRHGLQSFYNAVPFITYKFNEVPLANFSDAEMGVLSDMFKEAFEAFQRCPMEIKQRTSFISYSYFYHKSVELRGWHHYKRCFPLLEGNDYLRRHDRIWKWICENKYKEQWTFLPTKPA
jgi:hypothetical protein